MRFRSLTILVALSLVSFSCKKDTPESDAATPSATMPPRPTGPLAKSSECAACHKEATEAWEKSHHALAHRDFGTEMDAEAFAGFEVTLGNASWKFSGSLDEPRIIWSHKDSDVSQPGTQQPNMAIGVDPLVQYLLHTGDGRYQVPDLAWDPAKKEWFSIYGDDQRNPHEWGHWTERGMNWNSQCAYCHFTGLEKNHDLESDGYHTTWIEQGVGCAQCHGPSRENHGSNECIIDPARKYTKEQWMHSCATCHARRGEFDEKFSIGDSFHDHYSLSLPSQAGLWYPDGQQLDEVYKFNNFLLSRMGHKGIGCTDCHDPHAAEPIGGGDDVALRSNALCMTCHGAGANEATVINPAEHTFHTPGTAGASCIDCHMPKRNYMGRDPRSDHRFPRPDPLLTKELGTPNACNNCHEDKGLDWQIEWSHKWYGEDMNAVSRKRTRAVHAANEQRPGALDQLIDVFDVEEIDAWQATLLRLMEPWAADSRVVQRANRSANDGGPLARTAAALLIGRRGETGPLMEKVLSDPIRAVRIEAGWSSLDRLPVDHPVFAEITAMAKHQSDQPTGAMTMARLAVKRGDMEDAEKWFKRAAKWDPSSSVPRRDLAIFLSGQGRTGDSISWLEEAATLAPDNAEIPYLTALALSELGRPTEALTKFQTTVQIQPGFARAWYNLGLLQNSQGNPQDAVASLQQAAALEPGNPDAPYAMATIYLRMGNAEFAINSAEEAVRRDPGHEAANQFLRQLGR
ncbi:ammonia-forming cytochrome c nitrite reductase subunit c552 [Haloferula chungangensis]|uniref:Ammonia-forming cytochrome c nitrite reductase subunit c552 n=1 Tax=Haloferula chungangensis TaxID=1048331 RepID=A0ABW2LBM5_9BACT